MSKTVTITTVTDRIYNADGDPGYGWVTLRPNQPFEYNDGVATIQVGTQATKIQVKDGQLQSALVLHPTAVVAAINPETYYVVEYDIDGATWTEYFRLGYSVNTTVEWGSVQRIVPNATTSLSILETLQAQADPFPQYLKYDETTETAPVANVGTSRGSGFVPRVVKATGFLVKGFLNLASLPSIGSGLLLGRSTAGTGNIEVLTPDSTLEVTGGAVRVKDAGIHVVKLAADFGKASTLVGFSAAGYGESIDPAAAGDLEFYGATPNRAMRIRAFTGAIIKAAGDTATVFRNAASGSVLGRAANTAGPLADIIASSFQVLQSTAAGALIFGLIHKGLMDVDAISGETIRTGTQTLPGTAILWPLGTVQTIALPDQGTRIYYAVEFASSTGAMVQPDLMLRLDTVVGTRPSLVRIMKITNNNIANQTVTVRLYYILKSAE